MANTVLLARLFRVVLLWLASPVINLFPNQAVKSFRYLHYRTHHDRIGLNSFISQEGKHITYAQIAQKKKEEREAKEAAQKKDAAKDEGAAVSPTQTSALPTSSASAPVTSAGTAPAKKSSPKEQAKGSRQGQKRLYAKICKFLRCMFYFLSSRKQRDNHTGARHGQWSVQITRIAD